MRQAFVFDVNRCTGCHACQLACTIENGLEPDRSWRSITTFNERRQPDIPLFHLSLACNHCAEPACMRACPALAYDVDPSSGAVLIDEDRCIGCGYCAWACPFDAPRFDHDRGVMTKCTFCNHRLAEGLAPACAALCPTGALTASPLPEEELSQTVDGFPRSELRPAVKIVPARRSLGAAAAAADWVSGSMAPAVASSVVVPFSEVDAEAKVSLRKEWPLAVFTLLAAILFAMLIVLAAVHGALPGVSPRQTPAAVRAAGSPGIQAAAFVVIALVATCLGGAHLGKKARAWRIVLNLAGSPLSREIVAFGLFVALAAGYLWTAPESRVLASVATISGVLALWAIEDVYRYTLRPVPGLPHSANVLLTGAFLAALPLSGALAIGLGIAKAALYTVRKVALARAGDGGRPILSAVRLGVGLVGPALLAVFLASPGAIVFCVLVGESIDRCELYDELEVMTPRLQMDRDLARLLS